MTSCAAPKLQKRMQNFRILEAGSEGCRAAITDPSSSANSGITAPVPAAHSTPSTTYGHSLRTMPRRRRKPTLVCFSSFVCNTSTGEVIALQSKFCWKRAYGNQSQARGIDVRKLSLRTLHMTLTLRGRCTSNNIADRPKTVARNICHLRFMHLKTVPKRSSKVLNNVQQSARTSNVQHLMNGRAAHQFLSLNLLLFLATLGFHGFLA